MTFPSDPKWPALEPELRQLWADGLSTREIGLKIGKSKNAVIGRAHRLKLPPRPAPVVRLASGLFERRYSGKAKDRAEVEAPAILVAGSVAAAPPKKRPAKLAVPETLVSEPVMPAAPDPVLPVPALPPPQPAAGRGAHDGKRGPRLSFPPPRPAEVTRPDWSEQPEPNRCRWPMWGNKEGAGWPQRFCTAARVGGGSYCIGHRAVAYRGVWVPAETVEDAA